MQGTVRGVDRSRIALQLSNGQQVALAYDQQTTVAYQNQRYEVANLEPGDQVTAAIQEIVRLFKDGKSEAVRLHAARAVLSELMAVSSYAALKGRMAELERIVQDGSRSAVPGTAPGPDPSVDPDGPPADGPSGEEGPRCPA